VKIRIEGSGHCVEVEVENVASTTDMISFVKTIWQSTRVDQPRLTMGYAGQLTERTNDQPVKGAGDYQRQVKPVTS
jgi:hypothetical protein